MLRHTRGMLVEYAASPPPLVLVFEFNPATLSRTRTITLPKGRAPGTAGGYDFVLPTETPRVAQGVSIEPEQFVLRVLLDATDRMNDRNAIGHDNANRVGIEPELDTLRTMVEPKAQGPLGVQTLANLGMSGSRAFQRDQSASVLLLLWGTHILPVFLTSVAVDETAHLPTLAPYRAEASLTMQVIEGANPFYSAEKVRQLLSAGLNTAQTAGNAIEGLL